MNKSDWKDLGREVVAGLASIAVVAGAGFGIAALGYHNTQDNLVGVKMTGDQLKDQKDCGLYSDDLKKTFQLAAVNASLGRPSLITLPADAQKSCPTPKK